MDKPILFSTDMVRTILAGRKTQTRRVINPQPDGQLMYCYAGGSNRDIGKWHHGNKRYTPPCHGDDRLWVRETWAEYVPGCPPPSGFSYKADHNDPKGDGPANPMKWRPSIHMPREASRISLLVKDVRVERLQDIAYEDCIREGMWDYGTEVDTLAAFQGLWQTINAKRGFGWEMNPWVWVIEFKVIEKGVR